MTRPAGGLRRAARYGWLQPGDEGHAEGRAHLGRIVGEASVGLVGGERRR